MNDAVVQIAFRHGAIVVDLFGDEAFHDRGNWSADRLHLSPAGHRRAAAHILTALGAGPEPGPVTVAAARRSPADDLRWARSHLGPWLRRRLTGASSGDLVTAKRPELTLLV
jgi:hypothetical protein